MSDWCAEKRSLANDASQDVLNSYWLIKPDEPGGQPLILGCHVNAQSADGFQPQRIGHFMVPPNQNADTTILFAEDDAPLLRDRIRDFLSEQPKN